MEKERPWSGPPSDRGWLKTVNRTVLLCASRVMSEQHTLTANQHTVDASRLDESTVVSVHNESSLTAGDVTVDSVHVHVRFAAAFVSSLLTAGILSSL